MFKKALAAVAVLGAFAGSSVAADVNLYGIVDYGMLYQNYEGVFDSEALTMDSGVSSASRFGLKGSEDLGNGFKVSFKLENGFDADDGELGDDDTLFNREASLTVSNDRYGALSFGRMGAVGSSAGTYDTVFAVADAFDGGDNAIYNGAMTSRYDNMVTYQSPKIAGLQATAQYSFELDSEKGEEGHRSADRYAALAVTGEYGALQAVAAYEQTMFSTIKDNEADDAQIFSLGANYDFGIAKIFALAQYFENSRDVTVLGNAFGKALGYGGQRAAEGYAAHIGAQVPVMAGTMTAAVYYVDADGARKSLEDANVEAIAASVKYEYPLSARTSLYGSVGFGTADSYNVRKDIDEDTDVTQAYVGITHTF